MLINLANGINKFLAPSGDMKLSERSSDKVEILTRFDKGTNKDSAPIGPILLSLKSSEILLRLGIVDKGDRRY